MRGIFTSIQCLFWKAMARVFRRSFIRPRLSEREKQSPRVVVKIGGLDRKVFEQ